MQAKRGPFHAETFECTTLKRAALRPRHPSPSLDHQAGGCRRSRSTIPHPPEQRRARGGLEALVTALCRLDVSGGQQLHSMWAQALRRVDADPKIPQLGSVAVPLSHLGLDQELPGGACRVAPDSSKQPDDKKRKRPRHAGCEPSLWPAGLLRKAATCAA